MVRTGNDDPARDRGARGGLTLIEITASTFLVGALLVGALAAVGGIFRTWSAVETGQDAGALAQMLLSEILQQRYEEPVDEPRFGLEGTESSTERTEWDDVDDYHGWKSALTTKDGTPLPGLDGWTCSVSVELVRVDDPQSATTDDEGLKRITVTITDPSGRAAVLVGYRSRWGVLEAPPAAPATVHTGVVSTLDTGTARQVHGGVLLFNHAQDQ